MSNPKYSSPFEVDQLKPEGLGGASAKAYQLTAASVSPTRVTGRDEVGMPIEETIPTVYWRFMVHPNGSIDKVPMRTASVFSMEPEAERYEQIIMRDLVATGWIPLEMCPYSTEYTHLTRGGFVKIPAGEADCGGSQGPQGCKHMQAIIAERIKRAKGRHDAEHARVYAMKNEDTQRLIDGLSEGIGAAVARQMDVAANRGKLRAGKGEE